MYEYKVSSYLDKKLIKLSKKNRKQLEIILNKIDEIIKNPNHYKNLRKPLQHLKRVHIDRNFVLVFSVSQHIITFEDFDHHDNIYEK